MRAVPGAGLHVPIWLLGLSFFSAQLAAALGLPFAFASHFAPDYLLTALKVYRTQFHASATLKKPYAMVGVNVFAADTTRRSAFPVHLARAAVHQSAARHAGPVAAAGRIDRAGVEHSLACSIVGNRADVEAGLRSLIDQTQPDELIVTAQIFDHRARLRSFEITAQARDAIGSI